ncbi:MAG TPA: helix-turn-helix transcriptional regulator [Candidatus Saccharimonadales bacterium]|jgi:transcriptional regulator with XRE-family HTH domain|nr:helix-turn-helix transcriptional regulator [Candidatus Saccharimonadales bacterium]
MAEKREDARQPQTLGEFLLHVRTTKRLTLRQVEEATNREVSNAYLSQLEHGRIAKPSPNILYSLASVYAVPYERLMEKAGYIIETSKRDVGEKHGRVATFANENLTTEEEEDLLKYLAFLRSSGGSKP